MTSVAKNFGMAVLCTVAVAAARSDQLSDDLNREYQDHILGVRYPIHDGDQQFDRDGHPVNPGPGQEWEMYGGILIGKVVPKNDQLRVEGQRVAPTDRVENGKPAVVFLGKKLNFDIHLDHPLASMEEARKVLGSVFYLEEKDAEHRLPELRRTRDSTIGQVVYKWGKDTRDISFPKGIYTPEPQYTDPARGKKLQGTLLLSVVVDTAETVSVVRLERALGYGLDENARQTTTNWRFKPAIRNGELVNVEIHMDVSFSLY